MRLHLFLPLLPFLNMGCTPTTQELIIPIATPGRQGDQGDEGKTGATGTGGEQGPQGETGMQGDTGPKGDTGLRGPAGKSVPAEQLKQLEAILAREAGEIIVGTESYSFGLAPRITGFCFLTNHGRLFKLKNKNTQVLGETIMENGKIADRNDFTYLVRSAYGDDVKQYFLAVTRSGLIYASEDLETWKQQGDIDLD